MDTSTRSYSGIGIAVLFGAMTAFGAGCSPAQAGSAFPATQVTTSSEIGFAISSPAISAPVDGPAVRVGGARVLTSKVNLQEPIRVGVEGSDVTVTAAVRGHRGWTFALDPQVLSARSVAPYDYEAHPERGHLGCLAQDPNRVKLRDNRTLGVWSDDATSRVVAQIFEADGTAAGPEVTVSSDVMGAPRAVSSDGHHVVVAYFAATETGFDLVARSLETP